MLSQQVSALIAVTCTPGTTIVQAPGALLFLLFLQFSTPIVAALPDLERIDFDAWPVRAAATAS
jgi:hypothetical protein